MAVGRGQSPASQSRARAQILALITEHKTRPAPGQRAVYVSAIPAPLRSDEGLRGYFESIYPGMVSA